MPPVFFQENFWLPPHLVIKGEVNLGVGGEEADHAYQSGRLKNEAFYLLMILHIAWQDHSGAEGLNVTGASSEVPCLDLGCHSYCS